MTQKTQNKRVLTAVWVAFAAMFAGACTTSREPVSMVEPSYSYLRDGAAEFTPSRQLVSDDAALEFSNNNERALSDQLLNDQTASSTGEVQDEQAPSNEQSVMELFEPVGGSFMFEMARLADQGR